MSNNARVIRGMSATEQTNFGYHDYLVTGTRFDPWMRAYYHDEHEVYQPAIMDLWLTYTVYWITTAPVETTTTGMLFNIDMSIYRKRSINPI